MALTILEQVLDNVRRGTRLPYRPPAAVAQRPAGIPPEAREHVEAEILDAVDAELLRLVDAALALPALRRLPLEQGEVFEDVVTRFSEVALANLSAAFDTPSGDDREASLDELRALLAPVEELPRLLRERLVSRRDDEILDQIGQLKDSIQALAQRPRSPGTPRVRPPEIPDRAPAPADEFQQLIESLV